MGSMSSSNTISAVILSSSGTTRSSCATLHGTTRSRLTSRAPAPHCAVKAHGLKHPKKLQITPQSGARFTIVSVSTLPSHWTATTTPRIGVVTFISTRASFTIAVQKFLASSIARLPSVSATALHPIGRANAGPMAESSGITTGDPCIGGWA